MSDIEGLNEPEILPLEFENSMSKISTIFKSNSADIYWKKAESYQSNEKKNTSTRTHRKARHPTRPMSKARTEAMKISRSYVVFDSRGEAHITNTGFLIWLSCSSINEQILE